jgi:hypothetical protein
MNVPTLKKAQRVQVVLTLFDTPMQTDIARARVPKNHLTDFLASDDLGSWSHHCSDRFVRGGEISMTDTEYGTPSHHSCEGDHAIHCSNHIAAFGRGYIHTTVSRIPIVFKMIKPANHITQGWGSGREICGTSWWTPRHL